MKLVAFIAAYKSKKTEEEKEEIIKQHIKNEYVPFEKKVSVADAIINSCYWLTEKTDSGEEISRLHVNSPAKYMAMCMAVIDLYTDIKRSIGNSKMLDDFNMLNGCGALDEIVKNIDQKELKEFNMVIQMASDDIIANEFENHAFITKQVDRFGKIIGNTLMPIISQLDLSQINEILKQIE